MKKDTKIKIISKPTTLSGSISPSPKNGNCFGC
ncbi:hypothetical protein SAMN04488588_1696 [Geotoga petraea]|uniref:Uncharacterized protein n=1 Tax=Geotoga petraea TaxID=28234 RepID=A0A1G6P3P0_9BACT|nr:hypothetical protein SAMN04488588_1696 [Geotoga petraea]